MTAKLLRLKREVITVPILIGGEPPDIRPTYYHVAIGTALACIPLAGGTGLAVLLAWLA